MMLKLKLQYCGHLMWRADSLEKTLLLGKIEGWSRRGRQDEMIGWHHWLDGHEFEQALGDGEGQGSPICCSPWGHKELDMTEWLNNNKIIYFLYRKYIHRIWCALTNIYGYVTLTMEMKNIFITQITVSLCKSVFSRLQSLVTNYLISAFVSLPLSEYHTNRITQYNFLWFAPFT